MLKVDLDLEYGKFRAKLAQAVNDTQRARERVASGPSMSDAITGKLGAAAGLAGIGSLVATAHTIKSTLAGFDNIAEGASQLGTNTDSFQKVSFAAIQLKTNIDQVGDAVLKAEKNLGALDQGGGREALARLGLDAETFLNLSLDEKILALADAYNAAEGDAGRMATMQQILGRGAANLNVLFAEGREGLEKMFANAPVASAELVEQLAAVNDQLDAMKPKWEVFKGEWLAGAAAMVRVAGDALSGISPTESLDRQAQEMADAGAAAEGRRAARKRITDATGDPAAAAAAKKEEDAAKSQAERIAKLQTEIRDQQIADMADPEKYFALDDQLDAVFEKMQKSGGMFFDPTVQGLQQWANKALERGQTGTAETALTLLKEAQALESRLRELNEKIKSDSRAKSEKADADKLAARREALEEERDRLRNAPVAQSSIGALGGAVARLTGGDPTALAQVESARARERKLEEIERHLRELVAQGKKPGRTTPGGVFTDS